MSWGESSNDQVDEALAHFLGLAAASQARVCQLVGEADRRQQFLADGSPNLVQWLSARFSIRHGTARQLVSVAKRLSDLPDIWPDGILLPMPISAQSIMGANIIFAAASGRRSL